MFSNSDASLSRPSARTLQLVHLTRRGGRLPEAARGHLDVLLAQRLHDVVGRQAARREAVGIDPEPHRVLALAEHHDVADARHALDRVLDVDVEVVAQEERVVRALLREHADRHDEPGRLLLDRDAGRADLGGHAAERLIDAILHVDGGDVLIARHVEGDRDRRDAAVRAGGGHVEHALDAVDRLLERRRDRRLDFLRVGARCRSR